MGVQSVNRLLLENKIDSILRVYKAFKFYFLRDGNECKSEAYRKNIWQTEWHYGFLLKIFFNGASQKIPLKHYALRGVLYSVLSTTQLRVISGIAILLGIFQYDAPYRVLTRCSEDSDRKNTIFCFSAPRHQSENALYCTYLWCSMSPNFFNQHFTDKYTVSIITFSVWKTLISTTLEYASNATCA